MFVVVCKRINAIFVSIYIQCGTREYKFLGKPILGFFCEVRPLTKRWKATKSAVRNLALAE
jgi:hypothetical protein